MPDLIIFDLDDTLFDSTALSNLARENAVKAMIEHGLRGTFSDVMRKLKEIIKLMGSNYTNHFDDLMQMYPTNNPGRIIAAGVHSYHVTKYGQLKTFDDVIPTIKKLKEKNIKLAIITTGRLVKQWEKILLLGLDGLFDEVIVDQEGKKTEYYKELIKKNGATSVISIGDRIDTDIFAGNSNGCTTIRILKGKYAKKIPKTELETPKYTINSISELLNLPIF